MLRPEFVFDNNAFLLSLRIKYYLGILLLAIFTFLVVSSSYKIGSLSILYEAGYQTVAFFLLMGLVLYQWYHKLSANRYRIAVYEDQIRYQSRHQQLRFLFGEVDRLTIYRIGEGPGRQFLIHIRRSTCGAQKSPSASLACQILIIEPRIPMDNFRWQNCLAFLKKQATAYGFVVEEKSPPAEAVQWGETDSSNLFKRNAKGHLLR